MVAKSLRLPKIPITIPRIAPNVVGSPKTPNLFLKAAGVRFALLKPSIFQNGSSRIAGTVWTIFWAAQTVVFLI